MSGNPSRNFLTLFLAQALAMCAAPLVVFVGGIIGQMLSPEPAYATFPVAAMVVGTALSSWPLAKWMQRFGRKAVFISGTLTAAAGAGIAGWSILNELFWSFCFGTLLLGVNLAAVQQYRFAAIESVSVELAGTVAARLMLSGLIAAVLGPELLVIGQFVTGFETAGAFFILAGLYMLVAGIFSVGFQQEKLIASGTKSEGRPLAKIFAQPLLWVAIGASAIGYALMSFVMTATPLSMHHGHGHTLLETKWVIQSHILAMFLPSLIAPFLINRLGLTGMLWAGMLAYSICLITGFWDNTLIHYWGALILLGVGWNFLFVGGTALLPQCYHPEERYRIQAVNEFAVFGAQALAALGAGWVLNHFNWNTVLGVCVPLLFILAALVLNARARSANTMEAA